MTNQNSTIIQAGPEIIDLAKINLTYDIAFSVAMNDNPRLAKAILSPILQRKDFEVASVRTHVTSESFRKRSIGFDCLIEFQDGTLCDVEMQKVKTRMPIERMLYHRAKLRSDYSLEKGDKDFRNIKPAIVVVLLEGDFLNDGLPLYRFSYRVEHSGMDLEPGQGIYVANIKMKDGSTELGRLMEDINANVPEKAHNSAFSDALRMLKSDKGVSLMGDFLERMSEELEAKFFEKGREEGEKRTLVALYRDGLISAEESAKRLGISAEEFLELAKSQGE